MNVSLREEYYKRLLHNQTTQTCHGTLSLTVMLAHIPNSFQSIPGLKHLIRSWVFLWNHLQDPGASRFSGFVSHL